MARPAKLKVKRFNKREAPKRIEETDPTTGFIVAKLEYRLFVPRRRKSPETGAIETGYVTNPRLVGRDTDSMEVELPPLRRGPHGGGTRGRKP